MPSPRNALLFFLWLMATGRVAAESLPPEVYPSLREGDHLIACVAPFLGQDLKPCVLPIDHEMIKRHKNFGYTDAELQKWFGAPVTITLDETGMQRSFIRPPPAPGVHPRVIFNPDDLPEIRERLAKTAAGKAVMGDIRAHLSATLTGLKAECRADYDKLIAGDQGAAVWTNGNIPYCLMYEAFRCLVDDDQEGGRRVAAAVTTLAQMDEVKLAENIAKEKAKGAKGAPDDWRVVGQGPTHEGTLGLDYDFAYVWMTAEQRATVRQTIAHASAGMTNIGCETLRALHSGTSNWISWSARLIFLAAAIEGEPGGDPETYRRCADAQTNFIASMFATGEAYEGWGKNFMFMEHLIIMAKRGREVIASAAIRAAYNDCFVASMNPWGDAFTFCDSLGGTGNKISRNADVMIYHALFPKDVSGDFMYRNQLGGDYANITGGRVNTHHPFAVMDSLCCAIFATDFTPGATWDSEFAQVTRGRPLTYFSQDTCNLVTRSAWDKDALYLDYLTRAIPGGHVYCDRSHFSLYGLGRYWSIYRVMRQVHEQYLPANRSVLLADGEGPSIAEGRCVQMTDRPLATVIATDLGIAWNWQSKGFAKPPTGVATGALPYTFNDFRLQPSPIAWMGMPLGDLPNWYTSEKPPADDHERADWYRRAVQVKKAFRTAVLVRGTHPYALIVDDLQKDDQPHAYDWGMILADDLALGSAQRTGDAAHPQADIILDERPKPPAKGQPAPAADRHLLVRVLEAAQLDAAAPATVDLMSVPNPPQKDMQITKLHIPSQAVSADFKLLLLPYRQGQALPETTWSVDHRTVTVAWQDQVDQITFAPGKDGRTRVAIARDHQALLGAE